MGAPACSTYAEHGECPDHDAHCFGCGMPRESRGWCVECDGECPSCLDKHAACTDCGKGLP